ncbi:Uncharacterized protein PBTT_06442 [Plasmodiophora brassicae]
MRDGTRQVISSRSQFATRIPASRPGLTHPAFVPDAIMSSEEGEMDPRQSDIPTLPSVDVVLPEDEATGSQLQPAIRKSGQSLGFASTPSILPNKPNELHMDVSSRWFALKATVVLMPSTMGVYRLTLENVQRRKLRQETPFYLMDKRIRTILDRLVAVKDVALIDVPGVDVVAIVIRHPNIQRLIYRLMAPVGLKDALRIPVGHIVGDVWGNDVIRLTQASSVDVKYQISLCYPVSRVLLTYSCLSRRLFISYCHVTFGGQPTTHHWELNATEIEFGDPGEFLKTYPNRHDIEIHLSYCPLSESGVHVTKHFAINRVYQKNPTNAMGSDVIGQLRAVKTEIDPQLARIDYVIQAFSRAGLSMEMQVSVAASANGPEKTFRSRWTWAVGKSWPMGRFWLDFANEVFPDSPTA